MVIPSVESNWVSQQRFDFSFSDICFVEYDFPTWYSTNERRGIRSVRDHIPRYICSPSTALLHGLTVFEGHYSGRTTHFHMIVHEDGTVFGQWYLQIGR